MSETTIAKTCYVCHETKPLSEFYRASGNRDGYRNECKACKLRHCKQYAKTPSGITVHRRAYAKWARTAKGKATCARANLKYEDSKKGKEARHRYNTGESGKVAQRRYRASEKGKVAQKYYLASEKAKASRQQYALSEKGKAAQTRYNASDKGKSRNARYEASSITKGTRKARKERYTKEHPLLTKATITVNNAIAAGRLPRADALACIKCGKPARDYHHDQGYAEAHWLDVIAVCRTCHSKIHHPSPPVQV